MHYKLLATTLMAAALLGAPAIAYAQNEPGGSAATEAKTPMKHHKMRTSHMKSGTTTGMAHATPGGKRVYRRPTQ